MMSKSRMMTVFLVAALCIASSTACLAIFPEPDFPPTGIGYLSYNLRLGWYEDNQAWYLNWDGSTNDIETAARNVPFYFLSQKLSSLLEPKVPAGDIAARPMYVVINPPSSQGPIFSAAPGDALYSGFWQVYYITWKEGATRRFIHNDNPFPDPLGLPDATEADIVATDIVVQLPIAALGVLGGPWLPGPAGTYRMLQVQAPWNYASTKSVYLPAFTVFCQDRITKRVFRRVVTIPDVGDQALADLLGANLAPGLLNVPDSDTQAFWSINVSPYLCQFPLLEQCPDGYGARQANLDWTPVARLAYLDRVGLPPSTVISSKVFLELLIDNGFLVPVAGEQQRMGLLIYTPTMVLVGSAPDLLGGPMQQESR